MGLGSVSLALVAYAVSTYEPESIEGRLIPSHLRRQVKWKTINAEDIERGTTVPAHTNVILHFPLSIDKISRSVAFGRRGETVRYWGYCFPHNVSLALRIPRRGFPGRLFLSEEERRVRREKEMKIRRGKFSIYKNLNEEDLNEERFNRGRIRHQVDVFEGETSCYIMTQEPLPLGTDEDRDGANIALEKEWGSDPLVRDTDGDGISDGIEILDLHTHVLTRDSDGDGLIDGFEDMNRNGQLEKNETDPLNRDSDRDGLCDGICREGPGGSILRGEDVNLNGEVDDGETNPLSPDSDGDGIFDDQEYYNCVLETGGDCKYSSFNL